MITNKKLRIAAGLILVVTILGYASTYWRSVFPVQMSEMKKEEVTYLELPEKVRNAMVFSHNPENTNPWGNEFWTESRFQSTTKNIRYVLEVDSFVGASGLDYPVLKTCGYRIILNMGLPVIHHNKSFYYMKGSAAIGIQNKTFIKVDASKIID